MSNNKQQTAVEQFAISLYENGLINGDGMALPELLSEFKEVEKDQLEDAYWERGRIATSVNFEKYYNETYGGGEQ